MRSVLQPGRKGSTAGMYRGMPWVKHLGDLSRDSLDDAADTIAGALRGKGPKFHAFRSVLMTAQFYVELDAAVRERTDTDHLVVDLRTLLRLIRQHELARVGSTTA